MTAHWNNKLVYYTKLFFGRSRQPAHLPHSQSYNTSFFRCLTPLTLAECEPDLVLPRSLVYSEPLTGALASSSCLAAHQCCIAVSCPDRCSARWESNDSPSQRPVRTDSLRERVSEDEWGGWGEALLLASKQAEPHSRLWAACFHSLGDRGTPRRLHHVWSHMQT